MKNRAYVAISFLAAGMLVAPFQAFALSVRAYESESKQQRADFVANEIDKIVTEVTKANPALAKAVHDYFYVVPKGQPESPGLIAFAGALAAVEDSAGQGKLDLDKVQVEGILLGIIKRDVMPKQAPKTGTSAAPAH